MKIKYASIFFISWMPFCIGFTLSIESILSQAQQLAFEHVQDRSKAIPIIAIAGCSAVGKSHFASIIAHELRARGTNIFVLHQDDFLNEDRIFAGYKIHPNLDHDALNTFLLQNSKGIKKIHTPCMIKKGRLKNKILNFEHIDLIIFEGIYALTGPETYNFAQYATLGIFLDASTSNIVKWHAERNKKRPFFKRFSASDIRQHATCLLYEYTQFIAPSKKNAQIIVYKDTINSYRIIN